MTRERAKELLPLIVAYVFGKDIQYSIDGHEWMDDSSPAWLARVEYRIKPDSWEDWEFET